MENNTFNVAVLGAGNIGSAVVARLMDLDKEIVGLNVKKILVRDTKKPRDISKDLLTDNFLTTWSFIVVLVLLLFLSFTFFSFSS